MNTEIYFLGSWVANGAGATFVVTTLAYTFAPKDLTRLRDWLMGSLVTSFVATLVGAALCVASHLRWQ